MAFGLSVDGFAFTYGTFSVVATGTVPLGSSTNFSKTGHSDLTQYRVVFIPIGVRDTSLAEKRPSFSNYSTYITVFGTGVTTPHKYIILGR